MNTKPPRTLPRTHKYVEVANRFRRQIAVGELRPGDQLPSFAQMLSDHGIGQGTMERAYALLEEDGMVSRHARRGTFVAEPGARQKPRIIGVVWSLVAGQDPYAAQLLTGIQSAARKNDLEVLFINHPHAVTSDKVSGVIVTAIFRDTFDELPPGLPIVSLAQCHEGIPSVTSDDSQGTRDAVKHLMGLGHRRIGFLTVGCQRNGDNLSKQRLASYNETLRAAGIAPEAEWVRPLFVPGDRLHGWESFRDYGREKMAEWLRQGWANLGCTALLTQNDDAAIGAIEALRKAGYKVPKDISVIGFDGTERAEYFSPRLTTVRVPLQAISGTSVDLLVELIGAKCAGKVAAANPTIVLPTSLSIGGSTGPAPRQRNRKAGQLPTNVEQSEAGSRQTAIV